MIKLGIVDVGGGTRGIFGAGVLDYMMDIGIECDYFVGVSAGAANAASYGAGQKGRNFKFYTEYAFRKEYMGKRNFLKTGSYINFDYIYSTLSNSDGEYPLDFEALKNSPMEMEIVVTDALTGQVRYFTKDDLAQDNYDPIKASCCVPALCPPYVVDGTPYFDGGLSDPIPYKRAFEAGCDHVIVILTKPRDYFRTPERDRRLSRAFGHRYPKAAAALRNRSQVYNQSLRELYKLEQEGKVTIIAPSDIGKLKTLTKDREQLEKLYMMGRMNAENALRR